MFAYTQQVCFLAKIYTPSSISLNQLGDLNFYCDCLKVTLPLCRYSNSDFQDIFILFFCQIWSVFYTVVTWYAGSVITGMGSKPQAMGSGSQPMGSRSTVKANISNWDQRDHRSKYRNSGIRDQPFGAKIWDHDILHIPYQTLMFLTCTRSRPLIPSNTSNSRSLALVSQHCLKL